MFKKQVKAGTQKAAFEEFGDAGAPAPEKESKLPPFRNAAANNIKLKGKGRFGKFGKK